jgi:hypothetical protein
MKILFAMALLAAFVATWAAPVGGVGPVSAHACGTDKGPPPPG